MNPNSKPRKKVVPVWNRAPESIAGAIERPVRHLFFIEGIQKLRSSARIAVQPVDAHSVQ
jgi:hypothetical protein